jgi:hypothetical protein
MTRECLAGYWLGRYLPRYLDMSHIHGEELGRVDSYTSKRAIIGDSDSPRTSSKTTYFLVPYGEAFHHADKAIKSVIDLVV